MQSEPSRHGYDESLVLLGDEALHIDHTAPLEEGCMVAVFWEDRLAMYGHLARRPVPHRRFAVDVIDGGKVRRRRQFGPHDKEVTICRVMGRGRVVPI